MDRVLTLRELNRATLARQLLLERRKFGVVPAIERLAGLQAQWPPSPYVGLWSRLEGFQRESLERALLRSAVVKAPLMRGTLHLVSAREYPVYYAALREMPTWFDATHLAHALAIIPGARKLAEARPLSFNDALRHLADEHGHVGLEARRIFHAVRRHAHLLNVGETALWSSRPKALYYAHAEPDPVDEISARTALVKRYLTSFGPATRADIAEWSGLRVADFTSALEALEPLRRFRDENGRELLDLQHAPLPPADIPAPVRFLPKWDNVLLAHADRRRIVSDELRRSVVAKNGDVAQTVLVDGVVAGTWSADERGAVTVTPAVALSRAARREVDAEARRLEEWAR